MIRMRIQEQGIINPVINNYQMMKMKIPKLGLIWSWKKHIRDKIPASSVYKKMGRLEEIALIIVEKRDFSNYGHVRKFYKNMWSSNQH